MTTRHPPLPFPPLPERPSRRGDPARVIPHQVLQDTTPPAMTVALVRGTRRRFYRIRFLPETAQWIATVFLDAARHREMTTRDLFEVERWHTEFRREIDAARDDGWREGGR